MRRPLRKALGVAGLGINWGIIWGVIFAVFAGILRTFRLQDAAPGEDSLSAGLAGMLAGFVSGIIFGMFVTVTENGKPLREVRMLRLALWGVLASAVWAAVAGVPTEMFFFVCVLGGSYAAGSIALARKYEDDRGSKPPLHFTIAGRSVRDPLRAACDPVGEKARGNTSAENV